MEAVAGWLGEEPDEHVSAISGSDIGEPELLERVAALACRVLEVDEAVVVLHERARLRPLSVVARHGRCGMLAAALMSHTGPVERTIASGRPVAEAGHASGASAAAPVLVGGEVRGVLAVSRAARDRSFDKRELDLLGDLAGMAAGSLIECDRRAEAEAALRAGADVLARVVDKRDAYTGRHSVQVGMLARRVGERIGMRAGDVAVLDYAARLHDVGKLAVPDAILQKPGPLDELEWAVMRRHPEWGAEMVAGVPGLDGLAELVVAHHERWDGDGYPLGLEGEDIPLASRVICACDAFEAMVSERPYRAPLSVKDALAELVAGAGSQFDPMVVLAVEVEVAAAA